MNSYNLFDPENYGTIIYCAIARDKDHVKELAAAAGFNIENMVIDLERTNVRDMSGRPFPPSIQDALVH